MPSFANYLGELKAIEMTFIRLGDTIYCLA